MQDPSIICSKMSSGNSELENLSELEKQLEHYVEVVDKLIEVTTTNINKLNVYVNHQYNEIEQLKRKKKSRVSMYNSDESNRMTLFYDETYGDVPSNEDAIKLDEYLSTFSNIRKKYEYKPKIWNKKILNQLFENVESVAKKYSKQYLINSDMSAYEQELRKQEINTMNVNQLFNELKTFFESQETATELDMEEECTKKEDVEETENIEKTEDTGSKRQRNQPDTTLNFSAFMYQFWKEVSQSLDIDCSVKDCQTTWVHYEGFDNESKKWEEHEIDKLLFLCKKYNNRNWLAIARELNTDRSPVCCFEKYIKLSKLYKKEDTMKPERLGFNVLEDIQLQLLVSILGQNRWDEVHNYMQYLNPRIKRIRKEEDKIDLLVNEHGKQSKDILAYKRRYYRLLKDRKRNT